MAEIEDELEKLNSVQSSSSYQDEQEKYARINEQHDAVAAKLKALRLKLAKKNRELSILKRRLDEIPSRIELSQYQKRFVELYNQSRNDWPFGSFIIL